MKAFQLMFLKCSPTAGCREGWRSSQQSFSSFCWTHRSLSHCQIQHQRSLSSGAHCLNTGQSHLEKACEIQHAQRNMRALYSHPDWLFLHRPGFLPHTLQIRVLRTDREQRSLRLILSCQSKLLDFKTESVKGTNYYNKCFFKSKLLFFCCIKSQLMKMFNAVWCFLLHAGRICGMKHSQGWQKYFYHRHISNLT